MIPARTVAFESVVTFPVSDVPGSGSDRGSAPVDPFSGTTLFQASGWIEPDPFPIEVPTLYSGVIETVEVREGEVVLEGQLLATMVDEDARLDLETARAVFARAQAGLARAKADFEAHEATLVTLDREIEAARGRLAELRADAELLKEGGPEAFTGREIAQTRLRVETQEATVAALESRRSEQQAGLESRRAQILEAEARIGEAQTEVSRAELALDRTRIHSPVDGRIQRLFARPGKKRMLEMDSPESGTIAMLYQPDSLQARIDVPLEEAARVRIGQAVRLRSTLLPESEFKGRVTRIEGQADLQRNTLQVKVRILDPVMELRPEMLCRGEFLAETGTGAGVGPDRSSGSVAIYVPENALLAEGASNAVWCLDPGGQRLERRSIRLGPERRETYRRVVEGLRPGDKILPNPPPGLAEGERVRLAAASIE